MRSYKTTLQFGKLVAIMILACCFLVGCNDEPTKPNADRTPPSAITDFDAEPLSPTMVRLTWTATGDDNTSGQATGYDIRFSSSPIADSTAWEAATPCVGTPTPLPAGDSELFQYTMLLPESKYYFCMRVVDDAGNWSGLSNQDSAMLMPLFAQPGRLATNRGCERFSVVDIDRDGDSDIVKYDFWDGIGILINDGHGILSLRPEILYERKMITGDVGDLDGDLDIDIATVSFNLDSLFIFKQTAPGLFAVDTSWYIPGGPFDITIADLNGDGQNDLAVVAESDQLYLYLHTDGGFVGIDTFATGMAPYRVVAADLDGDQDLDLAVPNYYGQSVSTYLNNGVGSFIAIRPYSAGYNPEAMAIADMNGDGIADIVVTNRFVHTVSVLYGLGNGTFGPPNVTPSTGMCRGIAAADLDGDGDIELALANETVYGATLLLNLGGTTGFAPPKQLEEDSWCFDVALADMDGDGDIDLITGHETISVYLNNSVLPDLVQPVLSGVRVAGK